MNINFICTGKPKNSSHLFYHHICLTVVVRNQTCIISEVCLYCNKEHGTNGCPIQVGGNTREVWYKGEKLQNIHQSKNFSALDPKSIDFSSMDIKNIRPQTLTISLKVWVILKIILNGKEILEPNVSELLRKLFLFPFLLITLIKTSVFHVNMF